MWRIRGVFGLDILLPEDGSPARVIEVNPRLTSGFSMEAMIGAWDPSGDLIDGLLNMESGEEIGRHFIARIPDCRSASGSVRIPRRRGSG